MEQWRAVKKNELMVLESRFRTVRDELVCQMRNELDTLQLRFKSIKAELEAQHSLERAQLSKVFQTELALVPIPNVKT